MTKLDEDRTPRRTHRTGGTDAHFPLAHVTRHQRTRVRSSASRLPEVVSSHPCSMVRCSAPHLSPHFSSPFSSDTQSDEHSISAVECLCRSSLAAWPSRVLSEVMSPRAPLESAVSRRRSTCLRERTASTQISTISRPRWLRLE